MATVRVIQQGADKPEGVWPYTICIIANPWIEAPQGSGTFVADPMIGNEAEFDATISYALDSIFGRLQGQAETMFAPLESDFRIVSVFDAARPRTDDNALVSHDNTNIVIPRQEKMAPFLATVQEDGIGPLRADVVFAVTASATHSRCSAWFTEDDDQSPGKAFDVDGVVLTHRQGNTMPGCVALHVSATSIVALHEFGHAASSWTNGMITDLYADASNGLNKRFGRPIPPDFCVYEGTTYASSPDRGGTLQYPPGWTSYHPTLSDPTYPAVMDDFWLSSGGPEKCQHDRLTRQFLLDRIRTIMSR